LTIAISIKVSDGIVLAADSAGTIITRDQTGNTKDVVNIYNSANKVFNLLKGLPVGAATWGDGAIGLYSISTLIKDFRKLLKNSESDLWVDPSCYTISDICLKFKKFLDEELSKPSRSPSEQCTGFYISGYSSGERFAETWIVEINKGQCGNPIEIVPKDLQSSINWAGQPEAISRLMMGYSMSLLKCLQNEGIGKDTISKIIEICQNKLGSYLALSSMPIQDTIDLAEFLVNTTIGYVRFSPGSNTVGGPIDIAAITKHEGFKWVRRKHYYDSLFNPKGGEFV
jgi:hypothetical protein